MPNLASALKGEISRLSTKVARQHIAPVQSTTAALRKQLSTLKKQLQVLEREVGALKRQARRAETIVAPVEDSQIRVTAKGLRSLRSRLGLSAQEFGRLLGVGQQTIYNWESEKAHPSPALLPVIAELRRIGKREARARLATGNAAD